MITKYSQLNTVPSRADYLKWKRKNVTLRGVKELGTPNGVWGSFGKGLYTAYLGNREMARQYGSVYFVVNARPKNPKKVQSLNSAEIWQQEVIRDFCKRHGEPESRRFFEENTTFEEEMLARSAAKVKDSAEAVELLHSRTVLRDGNGPKGRCLRTHKERAEQ